jgi:hypothetical protein
MNPSWRSFGGGASPDPSGPSEAIKTQWLRGLWRGLLLAWFLVCAGLAYGGLATAAVLHKLVLFTLEPGSLAWSFREGAVLASTGVSGLPLLSGAFFSLSQVRRRTLRVGLVASHGLQAVAILVVGVLLGSWGASAFAMCAVPGWVGWVALFRFWPKEP